MLKTYPLIGAALLLVGCGAPKARLGPGAGSGAPPYRQNIAGASIYRIDPTQSELRLLVHRAGPLARFGHNHVIVSHALGGRLQVGDTVAATSFSLRVPVAELVVDDPAERAAEGADFIEEVPEDARSGTRRNMLSAAVLDADQFTAITLASIAMTQSPDTPSSGTPSPGASPPGLQVSGAMMATVTVNVAGHESVLRVPFTLDMSGDRISAFGNTQLRQSDLGLTPFSVMLGALQIQDQFTVKFTWVALKEPKGHPEK